MLIMSWLIAICIGEKVSAYLRDVAICIVEKVGAYLSDLSEAFDRPNCMRAVSGLLA